MDDYVSAETHRYSMPSLRYVFCSPEDMRQIWLEKYEILALPPIHVLSHVKGTIPAISSDGKLECDRIDEKGVIWIR